MSTAFKAHLALFTVALLYGGNYSIAKIVMDDNHIQPLGFILLRVITGIFFFWLFHFLFIKERIQKKDLPLMILCGLFGVAINQMFFFSGLKLTTPINASLIMTTTPMLVLIISAIVIKEKITSRKILGILIGASGAILLITYGKQIQFNKGQILGDLMIFTNAVSYAIYLVIVKTLMNKYSPLTVIKWVFTFGIIFIFPFAYKDLGAVAWNTFDTKIWSAIFYVLIGATIFAYFLNAYALKLVNPSMVSIYIYLQPLLASLIALSLGKDQLTLEKIIAAVLIFLGVYFVSVNPKRKRKSAI